MNYTTILIERRIADLMNEHDRILKVLKSEQPNQDLQKAIDRINNEILCHESYLDLFKNYSAKEVATSTPDEPCVAITNKKRTEYNSVFEAALQLGLDSNRIMTAIKYKTNCSGYYFEFLG